jgi:hypothetical protein
VYLLIPVVAAVSLQAEAPVETHKRRLTSLHNKLWGVDNLYLSPVDPKDLADWSALLKQIRDYAVTKADSKVINGLMDRLDAANEAAVERRDIILDLFKKNHVTAKDPKEAGRQFGTTNVSKLILGKPKALKDAASGALGVQADIKGNPKLGSTLLSIAEDRKEALALINHLAVTLELTLAKLDKDLERMLP